MSILYIDTETFSRANLKDVGAYAYAVYPSTRILLITYAWDDNRVQLMEGVDQDMLRRMLHQADTIVAHNAQFDRWILEHVAGVTAPIEKWRDTMAQAYTVGLNGSLEGVGAALGLDPGEAKLSDGKRLIRLFCMPQRSGAVYDDETHPEEWERFITYAARDVDALREIHRRLPTVNYRGDELALWHLDQVINDRGLPIDVDLARAAADLCVEEGARLDDELCELTGGAVTSHARRDKMIDWMRSRGVATSGYTKADVSGLLERELPDDVRRALEIRQEAGRSSTAKFAKFLQMNVDGRVYGTTQFCGAQRTGRWAGRGIQPQNFPRPSIKDTDTAAASILNGSVHYLYDRPIDIAASCVRSVIAAPEGRKLIAGDYSNIEGRMLAWLAGAEWKLDAFRAYDAGTGHDLYKVAYSKAFGAPVEAIDDDQRFIGKVCELFLGYQGAVGAFDSAAKAFGVSLPEQTIVEVVQAWRKANSEIVTWWYELEEAAKRAVRHPGTAYRARLVVFRVERDWLWCKLPSGRLLPYFKPELRDGTLTYQGVLMGRWADIDTFGGKIAENITQAAARDVMAYNMPLVERAGYPIVTTVHDEIVTETPDSPDYTPAGLADAMGNVPPWCPDLPLAVTAWEGKRYRK